MDKKKRKKDRSATPTYGRRYHESHSKKKKSDN